MLLKVTGYVQTIFLLMVVILGALCAEERVVLINCPNQTQSTKALYVGQHGVVKLVHPSKAQTIRMIGVPRSKTKSDIQYLTLFSKDTELYICYNKKWRIVGMKNPSERCYFKEGRHFEFISYLNNSMYIGFVCKNGACKSAGPEEKSECFSSTKHEPNVIYDYYRKHNNSHHRIRHRKHHQKHRDKHHLHTTTTITTSTTSTTPTTTTTTSTTTTTPQPARRRNKKKSKLSKKRPKPSKASEFVTAELLSTVYSSSIGYQTETVTPSSPFTVDLDSTSATSGSSSDSSDTSSISSVMDSSSYGTTDTSEIDVALDISSTNIPVSPNKLSSTTEYNNNYLINSNKIMINRDKILRKPQKHRPNPTLTTLLDIVPTATLFTDSSSSSSTIDWDNDRFNVITSTDYTSETSPSSSPSSSYYFNNELSDFVSTEFNLKSSTLEEEFPDLSSTSTTFYQSDAQIVQPTSSTLIARKKNFLNNFSSFSSKSASTKDSGATINHKVKPVASTSLRKLLEIEEK